MSKEQKAFNRERQSADKSDGRNDPTPQRESFLSSFLFGDAAGAVYLRGQIVRCALLVGHAILEHNRSRIHPADIDQPDIN